MLLADEIAKRAPRASEIDRRLFLSGVSAASLLYGAGRANSQFLMLGAVQ
jgi:hypothetical protein